MRKTDWKTYKISVENGLLHINMTKLWQALSHLFIGIVHQMYVVNRRRCEKKTVGWPGRVKDIFNCVHCGSDLPKWYYETSLFDGILPKGPFPPCLRIADRALLAGYPRYAVFFESKWITAFDWTDNIYMQAHSMKCIANETEDHDLEQQTRAQFTNAPRPPTVTKIPTRCWYYAKGECYRGSGCKFLHEQGPTDAPEDSESSASTTESEEREPTPVRKVTIKRKPLPQTTPDDEHTHYKQPAKSKTHMHSKPRRHRTPSVSPERTERQGAKRNSRSRKRTPPGPRSSSEENTYTRKQTRSRSRQQHNTDRSRTQSPPTKST